MSEKLAASSELFLGRVPKNDLYFHFPGLFLKATTNSACASRSPSPTWKQESWQGLSGEQSGDWWGNLEGMLQCWAFLCFYLTPHTAIMFFLFFIRLFQLFSLCIFIHHTFLLSFLTSSLSHPGAPQHSLMRSGQRCDRRGRRCACCSKEKCLMCPTAKTFQMKSPWDST